MGFFHKRDKGSNCGSSSELAKARELLKKAEDLTHKDLAKNIWVEVKDLCDTIITMVEPLLQDRNSRLESAIILRKAYVTIARTTAELKHLGSQRLDTVQEFYEKAIQLLENLVNREGADELLSDLAETYSSFAHTYYNIKGYEQSAGLYGQAIETYERIRNVHADLEIAGDLASTHFNRAGSLRYSEDGDDEGALLEYDKAIELYEYLVEEKGIHKLASHWGSVYYAKYQIARRQGDQEKAAEYQGMMIEISKRFDPERWS